MHKTKAFTLIELLVVIAIIALLMAIIMPALSMAKRKAATTACLSNTKNLALGWFMYAGDNDARIMSSEDTGREENGNFVGWCGSFGINPKQMENGITRHNTIYRTCGIGYYQSGKPSKGSRIEGNLIVDNPVGSVVHTVGEDHHEGDGEYESGDYLRGGHPVSSFAVRWAKKAAAMSTREAMPTSRPDRSTMGRS